MRRRAALLPLCLLLALPAAAHAQGTRLVPYAGLSVGGSSLPDVFQGCSPETSVASDARFGVARGAIALEAHVSVMGDIGMEDCALIAVDPYAPVNGLHTSLDYPFRGRDGHTAADLRLRLGGTRAFPFAVSAGVGRLNPMNVPYGLAAAGVRLGGRLRLAADVERSWYRVEWTEQVVEWRERVPYRTVSREEKSEWMGGTGVRVGVEFAFR